jgi:hypothetical protein
VTQQRKASAPTRKAAEPKAVTIRVLPRRIITTDDGSFLPGAILDVLPNVAAAYIAAGYVERFE